MYAKNSYPIRQEERFKEAITYYDEFTEAYPSSKYTKEAKQLKDDSEAGIVAAKKVLAEEAALIAKYEALNKKGEKKQSDSTNKKVEIKN